MVRILALVALSFGFVFLGACREKVGGPCSYKKLDTTGVVVAVDADIVLLQLVGVKSEVKVLIDRFPDAVEVGAQYDVKVEEIEKGTCVPLIVKEISARSE